MIHNDLKRSDPRRNAILRGLPPDEYQRVIDAGQMMEMELRDTVQAVDEPVEHVHFPVTAVFSYVATVDDEVAIEIGTVGPEGMVGIPAYLGVTHSPHAAFCQVPGTSIRLTVQQLAELQVGDGALHDMLNRFLQAFMVQMAQNVACNRTHSTEERAARWLLTTQDRVGGDTFPMTQQFLAQMLGVRRPTVTLTAGVLQSAGLITYRRGVVTVADRDRLIEAACDCYVLVRDETARLLESPGRP